MNLLQSVQDGYRGLKTGLSFYSKKLNQALGGIHPFFYVLAGESKSGKTSFLDLQWILGPYFAGEIDQCEIHYWSTEITRIEKEAKFVSAILFITKGIRMNAEKILGRTKNPQGARIKLTKDEYLMIADIYTKHIIKLFGVFDPVSGKQTTPGIIHFYESRQTPEQINSRLWKIAKQNGEIIFEDIQTIVDGKPVTEKVLSRYIPIDPNKRVIVLIDHIRGLKKAQGVARKASIDLMSEMIVDLRRFFNFTIAVVVHIGRDISTIDRIKHNREQMHPSEDDIKDSGNLAEDANFIITMMNPNDGKYQITKHFGCEVSLYQGKLNSVHIVRARNAEAPQHLLQLFEGQVAVFEDLVNIY